MTYLLTGVGIVIFLLAVALKIESNRLDSARVDLAGAKSTIKVIKSANKSNLETLATCQSINAENEKQRDHAKEKAADAIKRANDLAIQLSQVTPIETTDTECRRLDQPLPASYVKQLCIGPNCNH